VREILTKQNYKLNERVKKLIVIVVLAFAMTVPYAGYTIHRLVTASAAAMAVVTKAESRIGSRYVYGACHSYAQLRNRNQRAFDCSGLVNWSYYQSGNSIGLNTSYSLRNKGRYVSFRNLKAGDVVLFSGHAGVYIGNGRMVHAPNRRSRVKVTALRGYWRRRFRGGRRIINASLINKRNRQALKKSSAPAAVKRKYTPGSYRVHLAMNVREKPSISSRVCGFIARGKTIRVKSTSGKWGKIQYKGKTRYVSLKYATKV
jgi:uncharacterized protein YycO